MSGAVHTICKKRVFGGATRKTVILLMADYASPNGEGIWASKMTMAAQLELSRRAIQIAIKDLCEMGVLREVGTRGRQNGYTVEYAINLHAVSALPAVKDDEEIRIGVTCERSAHANDVRATCERDARQSANVVHTNLQPTSIEPREPNGSLSSGDAAANCRSISREKSAEARAAFDAFNKAAAESGWPMGQMFDAERRKAILARMAEAGGFDGWMTALRKATDSDFLCGRTDRPFAFGIDWMLKKANFKKIMEGNYDNRTPNRQQPPAARGPRGIDPALANIARIVGLDQA